MLNLIYEWSSSKPFCCDQAAWNQLTDGSSGLDTCTAPPGINQDPCEGETNWDSKLLVMSPSRAGLSQSSS